MVRGVTGWEDEAKAWLLGSLSADSFQCPLSQAWRRALVSVHCREMGWV